MGYVLIYRATRVLNLAHGDLMVFGAFIFFQALVIVRWQPAGRRPVGLVGAAIAGRADLRRHHAAAGGLSGRGRRAGDDRARHRAAFIVTLIWSGQTRYPAEYLGQLGRPIELLAASASAGSIC